MAETVASGLSAKETLVRSVAVRLSERLLDGSARAATLARVTPLLQDPSPEVQLQAMLTLGNAGDPSLDVTMASVARTHPKNVFLRDALYSGLANREGALLEKLAADPTWSAEDVEANKIFTGLARGVFGVRDVAGIELAQRAGERGHDQGRIGKRGQRTAGGGLHRPSVPDRPAKR